MSLLFSRQFVQAAIATVSKLTVGSAIVIVASGLPVAAYTLTGTQPEPSHNRSDKLLLIASSLTVEEKVARLEAAVLTLDDYTGENANSNKVYGLRSYAQAYSDLGYQDRAVELLDRAVAIRQSSDSQYVSSIRFIPAYIEIGEIETAESLLAEEIDSNDFIQMKRLIDIADAYSATNNVELAASTLSSATDYLEKRQGQEGRSIVSSIGTVAQAYGRLSSETAADAGLSRLVALLEAEVEANEAEISGSRLATTLSQLSVAQSQQGNTQAATALAEQAISVLQEWEVTGYIVAQVATAYGYLEDTAAVDQALVEMTQLAINDLDSTDPLGPVAALRAIATAYQQIGNFEKADDAIAIVEEKFGDSLFMLGAILAIHMDLENAAAQEATIQKMFDFMPLLLEAEFTISDVTAGYAGITGLVEAYIHTADDVKAQERLTQLENFFTKVQFEPQGISAQLMMLVSAAVQRGDEAEAQRLLEKVVQMLEIVEADSELCEEACAGLISRLARGYSWLEDDPVKQAGLDQLQQIAADSLNAEKREVVNNAIIRARVAR